MVSRRIGVFRFWWMVWVSLNLFMFGIIMFSIKRLNFSVFMVDRVFFVLVVVDM